MGGVISGHVTGSNSAPVPNAAVSVLRRTDAEVRLIQTVRTGDDGVFRITRLPAGDYFVRALSIGRNEFPNLDKTDLPGAVYYPSASAADNAVPVTVLPDHETSAIDISVETSRLANVSGMLRMRGSNAPVSKVIVRLAQGATTHIVNSDEQGRWSFQHVAKGQYKLAAGTNGVASPPPPGEVRPIFVHSTQEVTVGERDIDNLVIELTTGGRISGTITVTGEERPRSIFISAESKDPNPSFPAQAAAERDGTFTVTGVPAGNVVLRVNAIPFKEFVVKSITWYGRDLMKEKLLIAEDSEITNVVVVLSPSGTKQ